MKGVLDFLEKAGLVKQEASAIPEERAGPDVVSPPPAQASGVTITAAVERPVGTNTLNLAELYANAGVPASVYPAERLLRLVDGLSAMDETTRNLAIKAMDEADESWTIADPLRDADAKLRALADHGASIQQDLQDLEAETHKQMAAVRARQASRVGEIKKQMSELEALLAREVTRGDNECSAQEAMLAQARAEVASAINDIAQASRALKSLGEQFGPLAQTTSKPLSE